MSDVRANEPDQAAIDAVNLSRIVKAMGDKDSAVGSLRSVFAKAELQNLNTEAAKIAIRLVKKGDNALDDHFELFRKTGEYVRLLGKELSPAQYELFGLRQGPTPEDEKAGIEGLAAGRAGQEENSNPYEIGSLKGQAWLSSFREGLSERNLVLSMPEPKADDDDEDGDESDEDDESEDE